ncbi:MAG: putative peptidoglycan bound protein [Labilithrix sp.]|nr:putative peptidoglycan bound protein [Labilithrix sp.]
MRSVTLLSLLVAASASLSLVACAPAEDDGADQAQQDVTGGSGAIESPVVYLYDAAQINAVPPKCVGALLGDKVAVTAKTCAKTGMIIGRAADKDGKGARGKITAVHVPDGADADIAIVEIDRVLGGTRAMITHAPLRDGYAVNAIASADGKGFFDPDKGEASSISGRLTSETEMHSTIFPKQGSQICAGDIGAPVCSSTGTKIAGFNIFGTCGLSGIVVASEAPAAPAGNAPNAAGETPAADGCSAGPWKVAQLGRHADFIRQFAPDAFKPLVIDKPVVRNFPYAADGLWGYKTGGTVAACSIETTKLDPIATGGEAKVTAKVSFKNLQERSAPFGRFGIATKNAPTKMRWLPARATTTTKGASFETTFEGVVSALADGEYVVAFRASANGGEAWTQCDLDGIDNGFNVDKTLSLKVGKVETPAENPAEDPSETPSETEPENEPPPADTSTPSSTSDSDYSDPASDSSDDYSDDYSDDSSSEDEDVAVAKKKKTSASGCSASPSGTNASTGLPLLGILLGVAAFVRRRR